MLYSINMNTTGKFRGQLRPADIFSGMVVHFGQDFGKIWGRKLAFRQSDPHGHTNPGGPEANWSQKYFDMGNVG